ncbi:MAG: class I SAM-dependent methyltransferase [Candidatus Latescibacterota bacterium]|nr:class I SAM-dependent methyltransferase [Candidatus Latescibacterota bacterium]
MSILDGYPKIRRELPEEYQRIYKTHYFENRSGSTRAAAASGWFESWMHRRVAEDVGTTGGTDTLEIGGGTLNHLPYEPSSRPYDVVEPMSFLYESSEQRSSVRQFYTSIHDVPDGARYNRVISIATFEHICDLPNVVARCGLLLREGGDLRVAIPSEGSWVFHLGWRVTTGLEFRLRYGLDYNQIMQSEHVSTSDEIEAVLRWFFGETTIACCGLSRKLSLYQFFQCTQPNTYLCEDYIRRTNSDCEEKSRLV